MLKTNKIEQKQKMKCPFPIVQFTKGSSLKTQHIIRSIKKKREKSPFTAHPPSVPALNGL